MEKFKNNVIFDTNILFSVTDHIFPSNRISIVLKFDHWIAQPPLLWWALFCPSSFCVILYFHWDLIFVSVLSCLVEPFFSFSSLCRVIKTVLLGAHWCYFQSQVAPWKFFVLLYKMVKKVFIWKNIEKNPEKIKNYIYFLKNFATPKNLCIKMQ